MLALADYNGDIFGSWGGIARQANIHWRPEDGTISPFKVLMAPDPDSSDTLRNPENEGKRIEEIEGGFRIINYAFYRGLRNDDDRREQNRTAQAAYRNRNKPKSAKVSRGKPQSAHAEAEADTKKKGSANGSRPTESVEDWLIKLEQNPTYKGINVRQLHGRMVTWCEVRGLKPTLRRLVAWLNKEDKPMPKHAAPANYKRNYSTAPDAPEVSDEQRARFLKIAAEEKEKLRTELGR